MKKTITLLLTLVLIAVSLSACADHYMFSNGIQFGMSVDEVKSVMGSESISNIDDLENGYTCVLCDGQQFSKYDASVEYIFKDDALLSVFYGNFSDNSESAQAYIGDALTSIYGAASPISPTAVSGVMAGIMSSLGECTYTRCKAWEKEDSPVVWMFSVESIIVVTFFDTDFSLEQFGVYNTKNMF